MITRWQIQNFQLKLSNTRYGKACTNNSQVYSHSNKLEAARFSSQIIPRAVNPSSFVLPEPVLFAVCRRPTRVPCCRPLISWCVLLVYLRYDLILIQTVQMTRNTLLQMTRNTLLQVNFNRNYLSGVEFFWRKAINTPYTFS
jgi:hypothetical protein